MRRHPTRAEGRLWQWLRSRRFGGYKFRRQYVFERYIFDFFCPELRLVIEVDGSQHAHNAELDGERDLDLRLRGIRVLRIPNLLLRREPVTVWERIDFVAGEALKGVERRGRAV